MKKPFVWAGIIGGLIVIFSLFSGGADLLSSPSEVVRINIAVGVTALLWLVLGIFLITLYIKGKQREEEGHVPTMPAPNTPEDVERLRMIRNWILGFVVLFQVINSVETWILNDYTAGLTLGNIQVIIDLLINLALIYALVQIVRGARNVTRIILWGMVAMLVLEGPLAVMREGWVAVVPALMFAAYFIYAILAPLNRKNHRIAHLIVLPAVFVIAFAFGTLTVRPVNDILKRSDLAEQQFSTENDALNSAYLLFLQKEAPSAEEIQNIRDATERRQAKLDEVDAITKELISEYAKKLPRVDLVKAIRRSQKNLAYRQIQREQGAAVLKVIDYAEDIDFRSVSSAEGARLNELIQAVESYNPKLTQSSYEFNQE